MATPVHIVAVGVCFALRSGDPHERVPPEGKYSNFFKVGHNAYEIVLEFGQLYQGEDAPRVHSRVITSPAYVRELIAMLLRTLQDYEEANHLRDVK